MQTAGHRSSVVAVGETGPRCCAVQLDSGGIAGAWAQNAFARPIFLPAKENTFEVGFRLGRPPAKQQGPGSQRQPSPALPDVQWRAGCINGLRAFLSNGAVELVLLGEERFLSLCRLQPSGSGLVPLGRRVLGAALYSWTQGVLQGPGRRMPSHAQSCFHAKENTFEVGFRLRRPPAKQQGPGSQRQPSPLCPTSSGGLGA